jgi:cyanate permease
MKRIFHGWWMVGAGGAMIAGVLADATGNYRAGFTVVALLAGLGSVFFVLAKRPARPAQAAPDAAVP